MEEAYMLFSSPIVLLHLPIQGLTRSETKGIIVPIFFLEVQCPIFQQCDKYVLATAKGSRDSSVGIATGYGLDGRGSISGKDKRFFYTSQRPDRPWDPPSLLSNG
jgi:hypothetical protein